MEKVALGRLLVAMRVEVQASKDDSAFTSYLHCLSLLLVTAVCLLLFVCYLRT
jgi:hypothetical protein